MGQLAAVLQDGPPPTKAKGPTCATCKWLSTLDDETRAEALQILADPSWQHGQIVSAFRPLGLAIAEQSIGRHRNDKCQRG